MKKVLSLVLVACMLLTSIIAFSSCSAVSEKKMEKNAQEVLSDAMKNTTKEFFSSDKEVNRIIAAALQEGSVSLELYSDVLEDELKLGKVTETIYISQENKKLVSETTVKYDGETMSLSLYGGKDGLVAKSKAILGTDQAYAVNPQTVAEKFSSSALYKLMFPIDESELNEEMKEQLNQITTMLKDFAETYEGTFEATKKETADDTNALLDTLQPVVETVKLENADGKEVKCILTTYTLNNQTVSEFFDKATELTGIELDSFGEESQEFMEILDQASIDMKVKIYLNKKSATIAKVELAGDFEISEHKTIINAAISFSDTKIALHGDITLGEELYGFDLAINKNVDDKQSEYVITTSVTKDDVSTELIKVTVKRDKESGDFTLEIAENEEFGLKDAITLTGSLKAEKKSAIFEITSVKSGSVTVDVELRVTFKESAVMPKTPTGAKDIVDLTEEDIAEIVENFNDSTVGKLINSAN